METKYYMLNDFAATYDETRLTLLQRNVNPLFRDFPTTVTKYGSLNALELDLRKNLGWGKNARLLFIHNSLWERLVAAQSAASWDAAFRYSSCIIFYGGGGLHDAARNTQTMQCFVTAKMGKQVKILEDGFDSLTEHRTRQLKLACDAFALDAQSDSPDWVRFATVDINVAEPSLGVECVVALDVLLQGYLAIDNRHRFFAEEIQKDPAFLVKHGILQGQQGAEAEARIAADRLFRVRTLHGDYGRSNAGVEEMRDDGYFWFDECLPDLMTEPWDTIAKDARFQDLKTFGQVWDWVRGTYERRYPYSPEELHSRIAGLLDCQETTVPYSPENLKVLLGKFFLKAHEEYVHFLSQEDKKKRLRDLEEQRNALNHNRIKNDFLNKLANVNQELPLDRRGENSLAAWESIRRPDSSSQSQKLSASSRTVEEALEAWPGIARDIRAFFNQTIADLGFALTKKGEILKAQLLAADGCVDQISRFVQEFASIAAQPEVARRDRLQTFLEAADALHDGFSAMRYQQDRAEVFGGYVGASSS